ncbi:hypothetical protein [Streptomyces kebangsaanensis]|uniref:Uncharacterized protein n=1 Tax=Streptomyces kebangsaanensis TaxID=864058 RepID=A0ABW6KQY6_9ACTN|nr:hypothetical protein [Streptomyces kebangsaanensis]
MKVNRGGVMEGIGKPMEPDRVSARPFGDVGTATPYDDAAVIEVQVQV